MLPKWHEETVTRQNSFTYLRAVLGSRRAGAHARVADRTTVDPGFKDGVITVVEPGTSETAALERLGDYHVYRLRAKDDMLARVAVRASEESELAPLILIYDDKGERLLQYRAGPRSKEHEARIIVQLEANKSYKLVVGAFNGATKGGYQLTVEEAGVRSAPKVTRRSE
jgi:hypothetical protein